MGCAPCQAHWSPPPSRCHHRPLTNGPGRIPPYCASSTGAHTVTRGGGGGTLRPGPLHAYPVNAFCPDPPPRVVGYSPSTPRPRVLRARTSPLALGPSRLMLPLPFLAQARCTTVSGLGLGWRRARPCVTLVTQDAQHPARLSAGAVFAVLPPPPRPVSPVTVPPLPSPPSWRPRWRPWFTCSFHFFFFGAFVLAVPPLWALGGARVGGWVSLAVRLCSPWGHDTSTLGGIGPWGGLFVLSPAPPHPVAPSAALFLGLLPASPRPRSLPPRRLGSIEAGHNPTLAFYP